MRVERSRKWPSDIGREGRSRPTKSQGGKTWTFKLRKNVKFHTGRTFTAQAAKAAILRTKQIGKAAAYAWTPVTSIGTPNPSTLVIHLEYPQPMDLISSASRLVVSVQTASDPQKHRWSAAVSADA